jgi:8-oxo-dGTP diphosphatase
MEPMTETTAPSGASGAQRARVVVAAVIERDGKFLAARRTEPPALAGRWEFPGGKTEPGEDDAAALRRECREELGVRIEVGEPVGPVYRVPGKEWVVRTYRAVLLDGEPAPIESHDELRWLVAGSPEVRELPWLEGDYVILDALEQAGDAGGDAREEVGDAARDAREQAAGPILDALEQAGDAATQVA